LPIINFIEKQRKKEQRRETNFGLKMRCFNPFNVDGATALNTAVVKRLDNTQIRVLKTSVLANDGNLSKKLLKNCKS